MKQEITLLQQQKEKEKLEPVYISLDSILLERIKKEAAAAGFPVSKLIRMKLLKWWEEKDE